ncbi:hypothetical protein SCHPADRAFT_5966 [Schizopora paradoxa]|uniref:Uncharacterized protein n=1 Tax=Schizopora paradoxa TaxID=27342 RepID=A0A0H2STJ1_9AGAM|nr:hypothetical protein SCHPADRAFT_5966 [Schizopora paradoxa]
MISNGTNVGRPWTPSEDKLLRDAVAIYGDDTENWKTIALSVPGRTNKACRKRWLHSLCPTIKKTAWTQEEDTKLLELFARYPNKWSQIAREIPGRTDDACSKRYREALDPNLKKDEWTDEEDKKLLECYTLHGGKWGVIGLALRRSGLGCRNRWRLLERKKNSSARQPEAPLQQEGPSLVPSNFWTSFEGSPSAISNWSSSLGDWNLSVDALTPGDAQILNPGVHAVDFGTHNFSSSTLVHPESPDQHAGASFNFNSSSLSSALVEPTVTSQRNSVSPATTSNAEQEHDDTGSENWDFGMNLDNDDPVEIFSDSTNVIEQDMTLVEDQRFTHQEGHVRQISDTDKGMAAEETDLRSSSETYENPTNEFTSTAVEPHSAHSTLTFVNTHYPTDRARKRPSKRQRTNAQYVVQVDGEIGRETQQAPKLSSTLPVASDRTVLAYACGSRECWQSGSSRYSTSGELLDHFKAEHALEPCGSQDTPFRCGLRDCAKGWKSINGLQYHLQVSKAHFKQVLSTVALRNSQDNEGTEPSSPNAPLVKKRKTHDCHYEGCTKSYKQLSGLRYHLQHGHPDTVPLQLDVVPPTIARRMGVEQTIPSVQVPVTIPPAPS